jgi:hypothetical protein
MQIIITDTNKLSATDLAVLGILTGAPAVAESPWTGEPTPEPEVATPKPRRTRKAAAPEPEKAAPEPEEPEAAPVADPDPVEDLVGEPAATLKDAVEIATRLVQDHPTEVREALGKHGVKRVTLLPNDAAIATFVADMKALEG